MTHGIVGSINGSQNAPQCHFLTSCCHRNITGRRQEEGKQEIDMAELGQVTNKRIKARANIR